jgi:hypothetical protein
VWWKATLVEWHLYPMAASVALSCWLIYFALLLNSLWILDYMLECKLYG